MFIKKIHLLYLLLLLCSTSALAQRVQPDFSLYQFKETRDLVNRVRDAATMFSEKGENAFIEFGEEGSIWLSGTWYIFVYDLDGTCIFHPVQKDFIGQNLIDLKDINGKPIIRFIVNIASRPGESSGWIHYLWAEPGELFPSWKHAFVMGVRGPDGKTYAIGSGTYNIRTETAWVVATVDSAAGLIRTHGKEAYGQLVDDASIFYFYNTYVFVLSREGNMLVDPAFPTNEGRNVIDFKDYAGHMIVREMLERLEDQDEVYVTYLWPAPGQTNPSKKMIYARKVMAGTEQVIVGASLYLVEPIWKKF